MKTKIKYDKNLEIKTKMIKKKKKIKFNSTNIKKYNILYIIKKAWNKKSE